jgi:hypothetical protein
MVEHCSQIAFPLQNAKGDALAHRIRFNAYNRAPGRNLAELDKDRVSAPVALAGSLTPGQWGRPAIERMFTPNRTSLLATWRLFFAVYRRGSDLRGHRRAGRGHSPERHVV